MAIAPNEATPQVDLIYKIEDKPSFKDAVFAAFQHLLAIFVAIITPPLIIAGALDLDLETTSFLVSMALFASGVSTFIQCRRVGPLGAGLLCVQGTSFSFIGPIISAGLAGGLPLIFGCTIAAAPVEMIVSRTFRYLKQIITPLVSGIVVLLIGLSLIKVGIISCGGGNAAMSDGTFGNWQNLSIAALVLVSVLFFNKSKNKYIRMSSIVLGLLVGYVLAYILGRVDLSGMETTKIALLNIPVPFKYGLSLNLSSFIAIGLIQLTGVASRRVGYYIAAMLIVLGLFPGIGLIFSLMPDPVLGGATLLMFGTVAAAGIRIIAAQDIDRRATMILAISLSLGLGVELMPDILRNISLDLRGIFSSGITTGGLAAIISNMLIRGK